MLTPRVSRTTRMLLAGALWSGTGVMLMTWAAGWLTSVGLGRAFALAAGGLSVGIVAGVAFFQRLARDNLARLEARSDRACAFGFTAPNGWAVTVSMILLGYLLRHSAVPRQWLAVVYMAIGTALLLASLTYYAHLLRKTKGSPS